MSSYVCRLLVCLALLAAAPAHAAQIDVVGSGARQAVLLRGAIIEGDDERFAAALGQIANPVVVLASPGGRVMPAPAIGRQIRTHGLTTVVPASADCASACALVWLGGVTRRLAGSGRIGLHAMSLMQAEGGRVETHALDHVLRSYLNALGYSLDTTATIVNTPSVAVRWMDATELNAAGIATVGYP